MKHIIKYNESLLKSYRLYEQIDNSLLRKNLENALIKFISLYYNKGYKVSSDEYISIICIGNSGKRKIEILWLGTGYILNVCIQLYGFHYKDACVQFLRTYFYKSAYVKIHNKYSEEYKNIVLINLLNGGVEQFTKDLCLFQHTNVDYYLDQKKFGI